jgi:hypothetical protein
MSTIDLQNSEAQRNLQHPLNEKTSEFYRIFAEQRADKVTHHGYYFFYPRFLQHYRNMDIDGAGGAGAMLEIGIENKCSFRAWLNYFPNVFFYGIDIDFEDIGDRYEVFKADQSNLDIMKDIASKITRPLFFVIDDGSHIPEHQILTFNILFEKLLGGGTYIIEDIETSYWTKEGLYGYDTNYGYHHPDSLIEQCKSMSDDVNRQFLNEQNRSIQNVIFKDRISEENRKNISSVTFGQNCVIIVKKTIEERELFDKSYVWERCL